MLIDVNQGVPESLDRKDFDICIVGGGVAGIVLAVTLAERGQHVALLEGGGFDYSDESQTLYDGRMSGLEAGDPETDRLRYFGGTSGHWAGQCVALDRYDFEAKPYAEGTGWPIGQADIDIYLADARAWLESGDSVGADDPLKIIRGDSFFSTKKPVSHSSAEGYEGDPTRFGEKYRDAVVGHQNISLFLNANALDILVDEQTKTVRHVDFVSLDGEHTGSVKANRHILCLGGIETPRFILNAGEGLHRAMGPSMDHVGRYFSWHPSLHLGYFIMNWKKISEDYPEILEWAQSDENNVAYLVPTPEYMERTESLNFLMHLNMLPTLDTANASWGDHVKRTLCSTDFSARLAESVYGEIWQCENARYDGVIYLLFEQFPNADSRIRLSEETDRFGQRKVDMDCRLNEQDFAAVRHAGLEIGKKFAEFDIGRVRLNPWIADGDASTLIAPDGEPTGSLWHPMSACRMAEFAANGVVDRNLQVFGTENLYICSSAVFPSTGHANPTLTITQLALRLADHLSDRVN
ncbi:MAG: GMC family oxidoreductase [Pseudomonadota bacterium]